MYTDPRWSWVLGTWRYVVLFCLLLSMCSTFPQLKVLKDELKSLWKNAELAEFLAGPWRNPVGMRRWTSIVCLFCVPALLLTVTRLLRGRASPTAWAAWRLPGPAPPGACPPLAQARAQSLPKPVSCFLLGIPISYGMMQERGKLGVG